MKTIIVWVLIFTGPRPYPVDSFPTHGACVQAKYDYSRTDPKGRKDQSKGRLICRQQITTVR